jgi:hypothetical protein
VKPKLIQGNNRLRLCPATMQAVVQAWLDEELASPVEVTGVSYEGGNNMFEVTLKRVEEKGE